MNQPPIRPVPPFARKIIAVFVAGIIAVAGIAVGWRVSQDNARAKVCQSKVDDRLDDRAVWLYLLEQNPDSPDAPAFKTFLDRRLPALRCERGSSIPVPVQP